MKLAYATLAATVVMVTGSVADAQETASRLFLAADRDRDGALTRAELQATLEGWASVAPEALPEALERALPRLPQNQTPKPADVQAMMAALPGTAPAKPRRPRRVLVLGRAAGYVHSSIPLAARTIEEMGRKTGAWSTTITYDAADINEKNLAQYDALFLASTTGAVPGRSGGRRGHGGSPQGACSTSCVAARAWPASTPPAIPITATRPCPARPAPPGARRPPCPRSSWPRATRMETAASPARRCAPSRTRGTTRSIRRRRDAWTRPPFRSASPPSSRRPPPSSPQLLGATGFPVQAPATQLGPDTQIGTWPEFNRLIGGFFKFHWNDGQVITVKVDEPDHPLNAPFKGQTPLRVIDETYTFGRDTYSRRNVRVLTSVDYAAMSAEDKAKEQYPRPDGDYALSWIRREGKGRVFYEAHGHNEKVYAIKPLLAHLLYGMQYVLGDLEADDRPRP